MTNLESMIGNNDDGTNTSISDVAKQALELGNLASSNLDGFRLPSWYADYLPDFSDLSMSFSAVMEAKKYQQMSDVTQSDGVIDFGEKRVANTYWENMTSNKSIRDQYHFRQQHGNEIEEYVQDAFLNAKSETASIEAVHDAFRKTLPSNPRAVELMAVLGIKQTKT